MLLVCSLHVNCFFIWNFTLKFKSTGRATLHTILIDDRPFTRLGLQAYRLVGRLVVCNSVLLSNRDITCTAGGGADPGGEEARGEGASSHEQHRHHGEGDRVCTHYFTNNLLFYEIRHLYVMTFMQTLSFEFRSFYIHTFDVKYNKMIYINLSKCFMFALVFKL